MSNDPGKALGPVYRVFEEALKAKDVDRLFAEFYSPETLLLGTGVPLLQGKPLRELLGGMAGALVDIRFEQLQTIEVEPGKVLVDFGIVHGKLADGTKITDRSTCVFHKGPKGWRCVVDVFVRD